MREIRVVKVNKREIPVLISDEREALLDAKASGRAVIGLLNGGPESGSDLPPGLVPYAVLRLEDLDGEFLERVARRHLGLPWHICETKRLLIREMFQDDFDEVWQQQIGHGFGSIEELEAYTNHCYRFYEFGFWALVEKESRDLAGVAGLTVPREDGSGPDTILRYEKTFPDGETELELAYHIFGHFRRKGYARESCLAIMEYGRRELGAKRYLVRIRSGNQASIALARSLGFRECFPNL